MSLNDLNTRLGLAALAGAAFLVLVAIPQWVFSPSNVGNIILSPTFWPYILAAFLALVGVGLLLTPAGPVSDTEEDDPKGSPWLRLAGLGAIMILTMFALPRLGMVWSCMLAFAATAFMFRTRYPKAALVCAILVPLVLYAFFAHVAGVAIPQGQFVRLP
ncbi:tripartite tricarboxylate transporter TctB family protein [Lutimaribacter marinistellae]|uniref:Tripartite tricarboxylate transporter TctB family protein n=1 Tax=Lutimaribacter marinistellae TaxID=1820329 RepID=A0ABV7TKL7_9RHOB